MRIQHNIAALNSYRQLSGNNKSVSNNLEKLSSGYRINRAGDDAAGLAISEKMRAQITGLDTAQKNANDGISLVQTAEGALTEVHSMLNRMVELAEQSANGTYDDDTDRSNIQKEMDSLKSEIDRISEGTNFNGINLLDGSLSSKGGSSSVTNVKTDGMVVTDSAAATGKYTASDGVTSTGLKNGDSFTYSISYKDSIDGATRTVDMTLKASMNDKGQLVLTGDSGREYAVASTVTGATATEINEALKTEMSKTSIASKFNIGGGGTSAGAAAFDFTAKEAGSSGAVITNIRESTTINGVMDQKAVTTAVSTAPADAYKTVNSTGGIKAYNGGNAQDAIFTVNGKKFVLAAAGVDVTGLDSNVTVLTGAGFTADHAAIMSQKTGLNVTHAGTTLTFKPGLGGSAGKGGLKLQIGDTSDDFNQLTVSVGNMNSKSLGVGSIDVSNQDGAKGAISVIKDAINKVSSTRGDLGAIQNRLDHTINNLGVTSENMTAAESRIRDVDMAQEMMTYTKNNILVQASQAMLAQANQLPQGVLQLLQ